VFLVFLLPDNNAMNCYGYDVRPGERAPLSGLYEELNVFGSRTGRTVFVLEEEHLPAAPREFSWRSLAHFGVKMAEGSKPFSQRTPEMLREQAAEYRRMAETSYTIVVREGLLKLASRLEALADRREREVNAGGSENERRSNSPPGRRPDES
jgi:hypothetical protein